MTYEEVQKIIDAHKDWLAEKGGSRANLSYKDLSYKDLISVDLKRANLFGVDLRGANLSGANLSGADLGSANLYDADLRGANLRGANLRGANLSSADLKRADLFGADLRGANLCAANLSGAHLKNIQTDYQTLGYHLACPEEGSFIAWKKVDGSLVKLRIPEDARRSSATTLKCRCDKAEVLSIINLFDDTSDGYEYAVSSAYVYTVYEVGKMVYPDSFDEDRWNECSHGIHFFMNRENAITY